MTGLLRRRPILIASGLAAWAAMAAGDPADRVAELKRRFTPCKPTVRIEYDLSYYFLHIRLKSVARATVRATEGLWAGPTNPATPAAFVDLTVATWGRVRNEPRARMSIGREFTTIVTLPAINTLWYIVTADEHLNPRWRAESRTWFEEVYDLESGALRFTRQDFLAGTRTTNLVGTVDLARQGRVIADLLGVLASWDE
jgi:hypothetical protein